MKINFGLRPVLLPAPLRGVARKLLIYLFPVVAGVVVVILLLGVVRPRVGEILKLQKKISESKQKVDVFAKKLSTLKSFNQSQLTSDVAKVEIALPSSKDLPSLLSNLERLAGESQLAITTIQTAPGVITPTAGQNEAESFSVKVTVAGNFSQIKSFLGKAISAPRVLTTRTLGINSQKTEQQASLSATVALDSYSLSAASIKFLPEEPLQPVTAEEQKILTTITIIPETVQPSPAPIPVGKADPFAP